MEPNKSGKTEAQLAAEKGKARLLGWLDAQAKELKTGEATRVSKEIERLLLLMQAAGKTQAAQTITKCLNYLQERQAMITYATFREQGYPIGSGSVESANKLVVESRMKGSGMRWGEEHVNPMLALRNASCSNRWQLTWKPIRQQQMQQIQAKRAQRSAQRLQQRQHQAETDLPEPPPAHERVSPKSVPVNQPVGSVSSVAGPASQALEGAPLADISSSAQLKSETASFKDRRPAPTHPWRRPFLRPRPIS